MSILKDKKIYLQKIFDFLSTFDQKYVLLLLILVGLVILEIH